MSKWGEQKGTKRKERVKDELTGIQRKTEDSRGIKMDKEERRGLKRN